MVKTSLTSVCKDSARNCEKAKIQRGDYKALGRQSLVIFTSNLLGQYPLDQILLEKQPCVLGPPKWVGTLAQPLATYTIWGQIIKSL